MSHFTRQHRGLSLIELAISTVLLGIIVFTGFKVLGNTRVQVIEGNRTKQLGTIARNEAERLLSIPYDAVEGNTQTVVTDGVEVTLTVNVVIQHPVGSPEPNPQWKEVTVTATNEHGESRNFSVIRAQQ